MFTEYCQGIIQKGDEADLPNLDVQDMNVHRFISGCVDEHLREELLKLPAPVTSDAVLEYAGRYEAAKACGAFMTKKEPD